jgi:anaerobic ribonucleoside-triphosphate reductase activating protein
VLEELLEAETIESAFTPEYFETEEVAVRQEQQAPQRHPGRRVTHPPSAPGTRLRIHRFVPFTRAEGPGGALAERILDGPAVEGVTFLGGEPFEQAAALAELGGILRGRGLSVLTFSGYTLETIRRAGRADQDALVDVADLLMDGPFVRGRLDLSRPWVRSANQRDHFLTDRYRHLEPELASIPQRLEVRVHPDGRLEINGMNTDADLAGLLGPASLPLA